MSREGIYLVGPVKEEVLGSKLPSRGDVLSVLYYGMRVQNLNFNDSARLVIDQVILFWSKARIPTQVRSNCVTKLKSLYNELRSLEKSKNQRSALQVKRETEFKNRLNDLFDIATSKALSEIKIEEDREFLLSQRKAGRPGCMLGIDASLTQQEKRKEKRIAAEERRREIHLNASSSSASCSSHKVELYEHEEENVSLESKSKNGSEDEESKDTVPKQRRARKTIMTPRLVAALDKSKVSDRDACHILCATLEALNLDIREYALSRSSIKLAREKTRAQHHLTVKSVEIDAPFIELHWDSKLLPHLTKTENVDRLPVVAVGVDLERLLGVPGIGSSRGTEVSSAVFDIAADWQLTEKVQAACFDTTASNTGRFNGAATLLENRLGRDILWMPCRHHIYEVVLAGVFLGSKTIVTVGPDITLFKKFRNSWATLDQTKYQDYTTDENIHASLKDIAPEIIEFAKDKLKEEQPRDDYREFLHLTLIFLGEKPSNFCFRRPGAYHLARWMAKALYCIKLFLFRDQFKMTRVERQGIGEMCVFISHCYVKSWFSAPNVIQAPLNDINFLKNLIVFKNSNESIAKTALTKFLNHLWYFNEECVVLSLFDGRIERGVKERMSKKILQLMDEDEFNKAKEYEKKEIPKKLSLKLEDVPYFITKDLPTELITVNSLNFFKRFGITTEFLKDDPSNWENRVDYNENRKRIMCLKCVNDSAERGVKLMEEFNDKFTKKESQKQFLLQIVTDYRKKYPKTTKEMMSSSV